MPNLDSGNKPPPPSKPKPAVRLRKTPSESDGERATKGDEGIDQNAQRRKFGGISVEEKGNSQPLNGLTGGTQNTSEQQKNAGNRPVPVPRERKPLPLPKQRRSMDMPCDSGDKEKAGGSGHPPQLLPTDRSTSEMYAQVIKSKKPIGITNSNPTLGTSPSDDAPSLEAMPAQPKSPTYDPNSPPPKPPRGIPFKGPSLIQHSYTYTQGATLGRGGSLGRERAQRLPPAGWKSKLNEVEESWAQDERPRALSDVDLTPEQIKLRDQHRPQPPPKALKPKLVRQKSDDLGDCNPDNSNDYAEIAEPGSLYEEVPEVKVEKEAPSIYETIWSDESQIGSHKSGSEVKVLPKSSGQLGSSVVAELKGNVVLRNKPHLKNRRDVRQSAPSLETEKSGFMSHLKDNWKSQTVKRAPEKKPKTKGQNKDVVVEKKELLSKLAEKKKKGEWRKSPTEETIAESKKLMPEDQETDGQLFDFVAVVSLRLNNENEAEPYISFQFPPKFRENSENDDQIASIPNFCFPDLENENFVDSNDLGTKRGFRSSETFSFVLTDLDGRRNFGYCRHILVKDKSSRGTIKSEVYCIVSPHGLFSLYSQILDEVERQRVYSSSAVFAFLKAVLSKPMPPPGSQLEVPFFSQSADNATETLTLVRGKDSAIHDHVDFYLLFDTLPLKVILSVVSCLLLEKRVILAASQLGLLSSCCHGLIALIYPFSWLHTYIPVLPSRLIDMCCLPTPYLLGILSKCLPELDDLPLDEVVIVDLDSKKLLRGDESGDSNLFPKEIQDNIEKAVQPALKHAKRESPDKIDGDSKYRNAFITEVFVHAYIHMIGHFPDFLNKEPDSDELIQRTNFCRAASTKEQKKFLKKFCDTQAFNYLIRQNINDSDVMAGLFEKRLVEWRKTRRIGIDFSQVTSKLKDLFPRFKS